MKKYKYLLFDWDGSIVRTLDIWHSSLKSALERHDYFLSDKEIGANFELLSHRLKKLGHENPEVIISEAAALSENDLPLVQAYANSVFVLKKLKQAGKKTALVTTSVHSQIDPLLISFDIETLFDTVVCGDDVRNIKPDAEPILKALKQLDALPEESIMIGDSEKDIKSAHNANIDAVLFYPPEHEKFYDLKELQKLKPTATISDFTELLSLI